MAQAKRHFYITTPLYYVNDKPHLGTAYCTVMVDVLRRYHQLFGYETKFLTGTDEHGQKCQQAAEARGLTPQEHCDEMVVRFQSAWKKLEVNYDIFYRTTDPHHVKTVQKILEHLHQAGDIYSDSYEGWYSVSEEIFFTEKDLVNGKSPAGNDVTFIRETNYFFKMSKYQNALIEYIEKHPEFITPESKKNEVLGFLRKPLEDLCISRPVSRLKWGIPLPFDKDYVTYVWFDALLNYAVAVGLFEDRRKPEFESWWPNVHHVLGKDILTTHAVYWTTMLLALKIPLPKRIFAHGWILNKDMGKMSKSKGGTIDPLELIDKVGIEPLRYWFVRDIHFGNDAPFTENLLVSRINTELANNLGNLLSRSANLIEKYFAGKLPPPQTLGDSETAIKTQALELADKVRADIEKFAPSFALEHIVKLLNEVNRYLEMTAPWKSAKENLAAAGGNLYIAAECLRIVAILLEPIMPEKMKTLLNSLGETSWEFAQAKQWGKLQQGTAIQKLSPLFPRIETTA